jgi:hypothetical protein
MPTTTTPPPVPSRDGTVYLVLDDFGKFGQAYRETDPTQAGLQTVVANLLAGQYERPLQVVAFNTTEGWARDVTAAIAREVLARAGEAELPLAVRDLVEGAP